MEVLQTQQVDIYPSKVTSYSLEGNTFVNHNSLNRLFRATIYPDSVSYPFQVRVSLIQNLQSLATGESIHSKVTILPQGLLKIPGFQDRLNDPTYAAVIDIEAGLSELDDDPNLQRVVDDKPEDFPLDKLIHNFLFFHEWRHLQKAINISFLPMEFYKDCQAICHKRGCRRECMLYRREEDDCDNFAADQMRKIFLGQQEPIIFS